MAKGSEVIVSANPQGKFLEGIISGTPKPGTLVEVKTSVAPVSGRFTWQAVTRADGAKGIICVLLEDSLQGKLLTDAYVSGTRCRMYCPLAGEELNMLVENQAGTADDIAVGALFGVDQTDGKLVADSSFTSAPFMALEAVTDPVADTLLWTLYLGNNA